MLGRQQRRRVQLAGSATIGADGTATVIVGNVPVGELHRLRSVSVSSTSTARTKATVYRGPAVPSNRMDVTPRSGNGDTTDTVIELAPGEQLTVVWENGDPGATVNLTADGEVI